MPDIINPALVLAHARAWIGTPFVRQGASRGFGADCVGLLRGLKAELGGALVPAEGWRDDWAPADALARGLGCHMVPLPLSDAVPGIVAAYRIGAARTAHVGVLSGLGRLVHVADYAARVRDDIWPLGRDRSSLWGFALPEGCERGPDGITPDDCVALVYSLPEGRAVAEIQIMNDATLLARSAPYPSVAAVLAMLDPIYPHIEIVE